MLAGWKYEVKNIAKKQVNVTIYWIKAVQFKVKKNMFLMIGMPINL